MIFFDWMAFLAWTFPSWFDFLEVMVHFFVLTVFLWLREGPSSYFVSPSVAATGTPLCDSDLTGLSPFLIARFIAHLAFSLSLGPSDLFLRRWPLYAVVFFFPIFFFSLLTGTMECLKRPCDLFLSRLLVFPFTPLFFSPRCRRGATCGCGSRASVALFSPDKN